MSDQPLAAQPDNRLTESAAPVFDAEAAIQRLDGSLEIFIKLIALYHDDSRQLLHRLRDAAARRDAKDMEQAAHSLKSLAANFDARRATAAAARIEELARAGDVAAAVRCAPELEAESEQLAQALAHFADGSIS